MAMVLETFISNFLDVLGQIAAKEEFTLGTHLYDELRAMLLELNNLATGIDLGRADDNVKAALSNVKDALYLGADIDYFQLKQHGASMGTGCFIPHCLLVPRSIDFRSSRRIAQLNFKLKNSIVELTSSLNRRVLLLDHDVNRIKSPSVVLFSDIVGEHVEQVAEDLKIVLENHMERTKIIAIVGAAGIGKSTLARKIFNRIKMEFHTSAWVSVTGSFNDADVLNTILTSFWNDIGRYGSHDIARHGSQEITTMAYKLEELLENKKFLLVLDDIWASRLWDCLLRGVLCNKVASGDRDDHQFCKLREIGMEIVKKCDCSPLAIKIVAEDLKKRNKTRSAWLDELNNQKWSEKGLPAELYESIYISFDDLPPHLKQCFLYCCLFYEDEVINYDKVIQMLMAEGFIPSDGSSESPEALGLKYYRELVTRNLLEPSDANYDQSHCAIIPTVLRSFAQHISRDEVLLVEDGKITTTPSSKFRRVSVSNKGAEYSDLQTHKSIRALISFGNMVIKPGDSLSTLPLLRILHVNKAKVCALVHSLRYLKLLRYLDLSNTDVSELPEYIGEMKSLQYICLQGCQNLPHLPRSIVNLERLRFLDLSGTQVMAVPRDFGRLINLVSLKGFPAYTDTAKGWCTMQELDTLYQLMHLTIRGPENISSSSLARCAKLSEKRNLRSMWLYCTSSDAYERHSQEVYDELCPSPSLEDLTITGYFGRQLPVWLLSSDLENLRLLKLENLRSCTQLPCSFAQLPNLELLCIKHALSIRHIGVEFLDPTSTLVSDSDEEMDSLIGRHFASMATSTIVFPKLRKLVFYGMLQWKEWDWDAQLEAMHALRSLQISRCRLSHLPPGLATQTIALRVITIEKAKDLISIENFSSVVELYLLSNSSLEKIANLPNLKKLRVSKCPKLKVLEEVKALSSIELKDHEMRTLPAYLQVLQLSRLQIDCNLRLLHFISLKDAALEWDNVRHIEQVEAYADGYEQTKRCSVLYTKKTASFVTYMSDSPVSAADESESSSEQQE